MTINKQGFDPYWYVSQRMPEHFKPNFLYRHCWNNVWTKDLNAIFVIVGIPGTGKSTLGLKICEDLDQTFNTDRICYSVQDLVKLLHKKGKERLKPGSCVLFDEIVNEAGSYSRRALSKHNQIMNFIIANMRARRIILVICLPKFTQLDKDIREVGLTGTFQMIHIDRKKKLARTKFKWRDVDEMTGGTADKFPRLKHPDYDHKVKVTTIWWGKPSEELEKAYKEKKKSYMETKVENWLSMLSNELKDKKLTAKEIATEVLEDPKRFMRDGKFDYIKIMSEYDLGDQASRNITKLAERMEK